ncbi:Small heat shock protein [Ranunculus cassubicifolius]
MASSMLLRRSTATTAKFLNKFLQPSSSVTRSFNTSVQRRESSDDESDIDVAGRRTDSGIRRQGFAPGFFTDVFDPFASPRSLSQVLNMVDQLAESPFTAASRGMGTTGVRRGWDAKEDNEALHLRIDMPGLGKENVKISVEDETLMIKGEGEKEAEGEEESGRRYSSRIGLPPKLYKIDSIKAEMKNGVLKVFVPKVKEEDKKVRQVTVD